MFCLYNQDHNGKAGMTNINLLNKLSAFPSFYRSFQRSIHAAVCYYNQTLKRVKLLRSYIIY